MRQLALCCVVSAALSYAPPPLIFGGLRDGAFNAADGVKGLINGRKEEAGLKTRESALGGGAGLIIQNSPIVRADERDLKEESKMRLERAAVEEEEANRAPTPWILLGRNLRRTTSGIAVARESVYAVVDILTPAGKEALDDGSIVRGNLDAADDDGAINGPLAGITRVRDNVYSAVDAVTSIPETIDREVESTRRKAASFKTSVGETIDGVKSIPGKVTKTGDDVRAVPGKVQSTFDRVKYRVDSVRGVFTGNAPEAPPPVKAPPLEATRPMGAAKAGGVIVKGLGKVAADSVGFVSREARELAGGGGASVNEAGSKKV